jgi:hypothetical protein
MYRLHTNEFPFGIMVQVPPTDEQMNAYIQRKVDEGIPLAQIHFSWTPVLVYHSLDLADRHIPKKRKKPAQSRHPGGQHKLSGDLAHELFTGPDPFPLHDLLDEWRKGNVTGEPGYMLAVIAAYNRIAQNHDGERDGTYRPKKPDISTESDSSESV